MVNISERSSVFGDIYGELISDVGDGYEYFEYDSQPYGAWNIELTLDHNYVLIHGTCDNCEFICKMETIVFVNTSYDNMEKYLNQQIYYNAVEMEKCENE